MDALLAQELIHVFRKYLKPNVVLETDVRFRTICGRLAVDFLCRMENRRVGITVDSGPHREWRDAVLLGGSSLDSVINLHSDDLRDDFDGCLYLMTRAEPDLFTERALVNIERLAPEDIHEPGGFSDSSELKNIVHVIEFRETPSDYGPSLTSIFHRRADDRHAFWNTCYEYAKAVHLLHGPHSVEAVHEFFRKAPHTPDFLEPDEFVDSPGKLQRLDALG